MQALLAFAFVACGQDTFTVPADDRDRKYVVAEATVPAAPEPARLRDKGNGAEIPVQVEAGPDGSRLRWVVRDIPAKASRSFVLEKGAPPKAPGIEIKEGDGGTLSFRDARGEVTRYWYGEASRRFKKPFFYPLSAQGVNVLRGYPIEDRAGEQKDHPHHTGVYNAFGEVNGREYWSKLPIEHVRMVRRESCGSLARVVAVNKWGEDLEETHDVLVLDAAPDAVMDWTVTLRATNGPVSLGKDLKMAKEGCFAVRVASGLTDPARKDPGKTLMTDSKGNKGEAPIRADRAPWVHYSGEVEGKKVGVAIFQHPTTFRYPGTWHVRAYGLFAANPFIQDGEHRLEKGQSITLRYRVYVHGGDFEAGKVPAVFAGYSNGKAVAE